jgi:hypothetical protein
VNTCSGCKFWIDGGCYTEGYPEGWGLCVGDESPDSKMAAICYDEGIGGELLTYKDFGCNEYQVKK